MTNHKLIQGDCLKAMQNIPSESIDLIITDPPYGIGINKMNFVTSGAIKVGGAKRNDYSNHNIDWDKISLSNEQFKEIQRISKNQVIFGANHFSDILPRSKCWVVWDKRCEDKYSNDFADCELIWTSFDNPAKIIRYLWSGMLQENMKRKEKRLHPTQKPTKVIEKLIKMFSKPNDVIFDPFAGSGTTLQACVNTKRNSINIEISEKYCDIIKERCFGQQSLFEKNDFEFEVIE